MRKIFRIASFALLLAVGVACSTDDVPQEPLGTYPILFRCMDETRAVATVESMQNDANGFDVYAFFTASNDEKATFSKNVKYTNGSWTYQHNNQALEYWIPGATYYFKAVYPTTIDYAVDNSTTAQPLTINGYDITNQYDILVAEAGPLTVDPVVGAPAESGSVVSLQFKHLLANVVVKVKSEIPNVTVSNVSFEGVAQSGKYKKNIWTAGQTVSFGKQYTGDPLVKDAENYVDVTSGGILVIPEKINGSQKMYITTSHKVYDFILQPITWKSGMLYTYTLTIKQENIIFNEPTVEIWDEENATGSVIIK